jgi:raffinose/stachyose/melibiose transport system permease protein
MWKRRRRGRPQWIGWLYLLPALLLFSGFVIVPLLQGIWISFFDWDGFTAAKWVGVDNYRAVILDPRLREAFAHSLVLILFYALLPIGLGLLITAVLSGRSVRGTTAFRAILFVPQVLPAVAIGVVWRWMYSPTGPINGALDAVGATDVSRGWLGDFTWALPAIGLVGTWAAFGFVMVLLLAGVQKISIDLFDAARVDGAGRIAEFFAVTLPGLKNELVLATTITVIAGFRVFDLIYVTTAGGPGTSTTVPAWQVYRESFQYFHVGLGAAVGMTLALLIFVAVIVIFRVLERDR